MTARVKLFDLLVDNVDMAGALNKVADFIAEGGFHFIVAVNPEKFMRVEQDHELKKIIQEAQLVIPDGVGVLYAAKIKGYELSGRVTGFDLMQSMISLAAINGYRVFLLGAAPGVAEKASQVLKARHPELNIVGIRDGYFKDEDEVINEINETQPDILFTAMGTPKQEKWLTGNKEKLKVPVCMGVGGSFDVVAGNIERAPEYMQNLGLEWLHRLLKEPSRIVRMSNLPKFVFRVIKGKVTNEL